LIIGISGLFLLISIRCKTIVEPVQTIEFVYKNISGGPVELTVYHKRQLVDHQPNLDEYAFVIDDSDSIILSASGSPFTSPFGSHISEDPKGDSVILVFNGNKCTTYTREVGNGVFRYPDYQEYTSNFFSANEKYLLTYLIDKEDFDRSIDCN